MLLAACADFGGVVPFEDVSRWLSALAEHIVRRTLRAALRTLRGAEPVLAVVGMGKLGGREFTYHSDLDLIFLYDGGVETVHAASRVAQRLISYLTTMTGAGFAYAVDTRLRPSGKQGMLVTSFEGFERYQRSDAQTWEHLALVRARTIAGSAAPCDRSLARVQARAFGVGVRPLGRGRGHAPPRRARARRRHGASTIELKIGARRAHGRRVPRRGRGARAGPRARGGADPERCPRCCATGSARRASATLAHYRLLRLVEGRLRWCMGRAVESCDRADARLPDVAELVEPGLDAAGLVARIDAAQAAIRAAFEAVAAAGTIRALR